MSAAAAVVRFDQDPVGSRTAIEDIRHSAQEAMVEMNALLQQLSPAPLEKVGLQQALRDQCEALGYRSGAQVNVAFGEMPADDRLPSGAVDQPVPGGAGSVEQHRPARPRPASAFVPGAARTRRAARTEHHRRWSRLRSINGESGHGVRRNIRGRVQAMNGTLQLRSVPGQGTSLHIHIPLLEPLEAQGENMVVRPIYHSTGFSWSVCSAGWH